MYDKRERAIRDYEWAMSASKQEGREEGREEGQDIGILIGQVQLLQKLLGLRPTAKSALAKRSQEQLSERIDELQKRLRSRKP